MTIGAFVMILIALHFAVGWLLVLYVINLYAGNPYWDVVMDLFWPVGIPALIFFLVGIFLQVSYLRKKKKGVPSGSLPTVVPLAVYPMLSGILLFVVSALWFLYLFDHYSMTIALGSIGMPLLLLALSIVSFIAAALLRKRRQH